MAKKILFIFSFFILLLSAQSAFAASPVVSITSPADGSTFNQGSTITLIGSATDTEDGTVTGNSLRWTSQLNGALGTGSPLDVTNLKQGTHTITFVATDADSNSTSTTITVTINNPLPVVTINSPANNSTFTANDTVSFDATVVDTQDGPITGGSLIWTSSRDGQIGTGERFTTNSLTSGAHVITLRATDSHGGVTIGTINITISNTKPVAEILLPATNGLSFTAGETITFQGRGTDTEDGTILDSTLTWTSSLNGALGTGATISTKALQPGNHTITLTVRDSNGLISDPVTRTLTISNSGPTATITAPANNSIFQEGASVTFTGTALDPEDGNLSGASLEWSSNKDGILGTGVSLKTSSLSAGIHTITLTATDNDGVKGTATITITTGNTAPVPEIKTPVPGKIFQDGDDVDFYGAATDKEDGNLSGASLVWSSSRDGQIGTGATFSSSSLSTGEHVITLTATDSYNTSASVSVTIFYGNMPPVPMIHKPTNNTEYELGQSVILHGTATDTEDGDLTGNSLVWVSNNNGMLTTIGSGNSFSTNSLKSGSHTITLTATDSGGAKKQASVTINIREMISNKSSLSILSGKTDTFTITGGTEPLRVFSRRSHIAAASIDGRTILVKGVSPGQSDITVTDSAKNSITIPAIITSSENEIPVARASLKKGSSTETVVYEGDSLVLDGSSSSDDAAIASYKWTLIYGSIPIYLDNQYSAKAYFTAPPVSGNQKFIFQLLIKDNMGATASANVEFIIMEKTSSFKTSSDILPVETSVNSNKYLGVKYIPGLIKAEAKTPGEDKRNRPSSFPYNLVRLEKKLSGASVSGITLMSGETAAQFIIHLPERAPSKTFWYQENTATGWENLNEAANPQSEGAFFNSERNQVFINIQDNGKYDLDPNLKSVVTVSGLGSNSGDSGSGGSSSGGGGGGGGGGCFINALF